MICLKSSKFKENQLNKENKFFFAIIISLPPINWCEDLTGQPDLGNDLRFRIKKYLAHNLKINYENNTWYSHDTNTLISTFEYNLFIINDNEQPGFTLFPCSC